MALVKRLQARAALIAAKFIFALTLGGLLVAGFVIAGLSQHEHKIDQLAICATFRGKSVDAVFLSTEIDKRTEKRSASGYLSWDDAYRLEVASVGCEDRM
jgi:hypothetical protein